MSVAPSIGDAGENTIWEMEYQKLSSRHRALELRQEITHSAAKKLRESRDSWTKYAQSLEAKIEMLEKKLKRNENMDDRSPASSIIKPRPLRADTSGIASGQTALGSGTTYNAEPAAIPGPNDDAIKTPTGREKTTPTPRPVLPTHAGQLADEETQDGDDNSYELPPIPPGGASQYAATIKEEPSSDTPVVVSERQVRKRKHADDGVGIAVPPRRVKSEQSTSSDPVMMSEVPTFRPQESIDLDEEDYRMPTPRKQRPFQHRHARSGEVAALMQDEPPIEPRLAAALSAKEQLNTPSRGLNARPDHSAVSSLSPHKLSKTRRDRTSPVKAGWTKHSGISDVAEESTESFYSPVAQQSGKEPAHQTPAQGRLSTLLNYGSPNTTTGRLSPFRFGRDNPYPPNKENKENMPQYKETKQYDDDPAKAAPATPLRKPAQDRGNLQGARRLRDRPLADLRPEDFKVNPKSNNGYRHAFDEVVRNKAERSELAGCTDPSCCGKKFRVMAESELSAGGPGLLSRAADTKMMESYLGDEAYRLFDMTREERQETWLKAKIQDLADRYGRHRHRFARRPTPPGYWNPDFPSTQEIEKSKEEAEKMERGLVEERWREAMRAGGRWLFRDE